MLDHIAPAQADQVMLGFETNDDAAVVRVNDDLAILQTVDFFTPIVDDPYDFGRIAAANSLSDIYAMGGEPVCAMNLLAFPCAMPSEVVGEVVRGGAEVCAAAGAAIVGGHTIDDEEPKFGLSIMGQVAPSQVLYNAGARPGDALVLTKPLGTGVISTALKAGLFDETDARAQTAITSMVTLNRDAARAAQALRAAGEGPHACTDVSGFGLVGHAHEMAQASGCAVRLRMAALPLLLGAWGLAQQGVAPGKTAELIDWSDSFTAFDTQANMAELLVWSRIICDPQTSGGLLLALTPAAAVRYTAAFPDACVVGEFMGGPAGRVVVS